MRRTLGSLLITTLLVSACQNKAFLTTSSTGVVAPGGLNGPVTELTGSVFMDATYVVAAGGGNVIAPGGGNVVPPGGGNVPGVIAPGGGNVIAPGGGNVIAPGGGNVIAPGGGNVIAPGGGNVIAPGGGNVIAAGGGNLIMVGGNVIAAGGGNVIAPGGGNVIAPGGGNVIAPGGGNYRLLDIVVPFGDMLPAQGMVAVPVSLLTGKPIGPAVFTDASGQFKLQVPESEKGNVRIVTAVPAKTKDDPLLTNTRLHYEVLVQPGASAPVVDEDTAVLYNYIRTSLAGRFYGLLSETNRGSWGEDVENWVKVGDNAFIKGLLDELYQNMQDAKTSELGDVERHQLAQELADTVMYYVKLDEAMVDKNQPDWHPDKDEKAVDALQQILRMVRAAANQKMAGDPEYFNKTPYVMGANVDRSEKDKWKILKAGDFSDFAVNQYLSVNDVSSIKKLGEIFQGLGVEGDQVPRLMAAEFGILQKVGMTMFLDGTAKKAMMDRIKAAK